jgi:hypothetical protein
MYKIFYVSEQLQIWQKCDCLRPYPTYLLLLYTNNVYRCPYTRTVYDNTCGQQQKQLI